MNEMQILKNLEFNKYNAKSTGESLLIHSFNVFSLVNNLLDFISNLNDKDKIKLRFASLLHDYGKIHLEFQNNLHGKHRLLDEEVPRIKEIILSVENFDEKEIQDIIYIIQNHHGIDLEKVNNERNRLTRIVSICDTIASSHDINDEVINLINSLIDSVEYECFSVELIEHPISSYVIGVFDYIYKLNEIEPILFSKNGTLFIKKRSKKILNIQEVNKFLNEKINDDFGSKGILTFDNSNNKIYTKSDDFLKLASNEGKFIEITEEEVERRLKGFKKKLDWSNDKEKIYLIGRVCGSVYHYLMEIVSEQIKKLQCENKNAILDKLKEREDEIIKYINPNTQEKPKRKTLFSAELGGRADGKTVDFIESKYGKNVSYKLVLQSILKDFKSELQFLSEQDIFSHYDIIDLMIKDSNLIDTKNLDIQKEARGDYEKYWDKNPIDVCRICHTFKQEPTSASLFPSSDLGGGKDVFLTDLMRRSTEFKDKGGVCKWCYLWFLLLKNKTGNKMYKLCVVPHALFGRIDWEEVFESDRPLSIGSTTENYIYPHIAVLGLSGKKYNGMISQSVKSNILEKLYSNGLRGKVISTLVEPTHFLFDCGAIQIDTSEYKLLKPILENVNPSKNANYYALAIKSIKNNMYSWGYLIKTKKIKGDAKMTKELGEQTGLSYLKNIWIGGVGENRVSNAEKVIRRMNETLRKLKDKDEKEVVIDAIVSIGLKVAISTRATKEHPGIYGKENIKGQLELESFKKIAEKLYEYKENSAQRTELVRAMSCYLGYVPYTLEV